eukprot:c45954_g1_i1.p1 GENE.c45954_g1_i1~~c45954_g1_i1.p1  ORF type:complete len:852 (-),score=173.42 c45954_g1_i1:50-2350(-)
MTSVGIFQGGPDGFQTENFPVLENVEAWAEVDDEIDREGWRTAHAIEWRAIFAPGQPAYSDVRQGNIGDCYMLASLKSILSKPWGPRYMTQVLTFHHRTVPVPVFRKDFENGKKIADWDRVTPDEIANDPDSYLGRLRVYQDQRCLIFPLKYITSKCSRGRCMVGANRDSTEKPNWVNLFEIGFMYYKWYTKNMREFELKFQSFLEYRPQFAEGRDFVAKSPIALNTVGIFDLPEFTASETDMVPDTGAPNSIAAEALKQLLKWYNPSERNFDGLSVTQKRRLIQTLRGVVLDNSGPLSLEMISGGHPDHVDPLFFAKPDWGVYGVSDSPDRWLRVRRFNKNVLDNSYRSLTNIQGERRLEMRLSLYNSHRSRAPDAWIEFQTPVEPAKMLFMTMEELGRNFDNNPLSVTISGVSNVPGFQKSNPAWLCRAHTSTGSVAWSLTTGFNLPDCDYMWDTSFSDPIGIFVVNSPDESTAETTSVATAETAKLAHKDLLKLPSNTKVQAFRIVKESDGSFVRSEFQFMKIEFRNAIKPERTDHWFHMPNVVKGSNLRGVLIVQPHRCPQSKSLRDSMDKLSSISSCSSYEPIPVAEDDDKGCIQTSFELIEEALGDRGQIALYASSRPNSEVPACCNQLLSALLGLNGETMCQGLAFGHAYALIGAKKMKVGGKTYMFVLLSNPWGSIGRRYSYSSWFGTFTRSQAGLAEQNGNFWMEMTDFMINFERVYGFSLNNRMTAILTSVAKVGADGLGPKLPFSADTESISPII